MPVLGLSFFTTYTFKVSEGKVNLFHIPPCLNNEPVPTEKPFNFEKPTQLFCIILF